MRKLFGWSEELIRLYFQGLGTIDYKEDTVKYMVHSSYQYEWAASCMAIDFNGCCLGPICKFWNYRTGRRKTNAR